MYRSCHLTLFIFFLLCLESHTFAQSANSERTPPNIVFFFVDDMGWQDTSVPFHTSETELNRRYFTPNMERLAEEGMKFTQAYASAVCSPSRVSLMTGITAARHRVTNWTLHKDQSPDEENPVVKSPQWNLNGLSPEKGIQQTFYYKDILPEKLKEVGYKTIHVGKAHFGAVGTPGENPLNLGFDVNIGGHAAGGPGSYLGVNDFSAVWRNGDKVWDIPGLYQYHGKDIYLTEALTREAIKAASKSIEESKPFYLYMSQYAIHAPWEKDNRYIQKYLDKGLSEHEATYAAMIEGMDKSLGDIMDFLEDSKLVENTIIVFMSDNGAHKQVPQNSPLRGWKLSPYEGGIRVPLIVKWPGVTKPGSVVEKQVIIEDIYPTFLDMSGNLPRSVSRKIDGISFVPLLQGKSEIESDRTFLWHYPNTYYNPPYSVIRKGDWKLIYHHVDQSLELFNLKTDLSEKENLSLSNPEKTKEMAIIMSKLLKETNAQMPIIKATDKPVPMPSEIID
ncbi:sulfatase [Algoriphagus machipongonensis]|uniref:N-acetylgalactosamine-6-sulfatase n=1 Tax=Algoriphagus machipongonensis TaxID=388413 RepID=A3HZ00_9BACT|nr:sulfatase [Algoriphagus machipongonensis]EAZ80486.1 N-acetylgalactosamine-6-sulfatase [Algoriphagus machipongonensis]